jgi:hypothetical protein
MHKDGGLFTQYGTWYYKQPSTSCQLWRTISYLRDPQANKLHLSKFRQDNSAVVVT